jgi:hypothetical protein
MHIDNINSHFGRSNGPHPFYYPIDDKRRRRGICKYIRGQGRGVDRAENDRLRHRCENGWCVAQPKQPQTIAMHQMMAEGVGNRMEAGRRLNILGRLSYGRLR